MSSRSSSIDIMLRVRGGRKSATQLRAISKEAEAMGRRGTAAMAAFAAKADKTLNFGRKWTRHVTFPVLAGAAVMGKTALDFSDSMNQIETQAGATANEVTNMSNRVLDFAKSGKSSATPLELSKGLFRIESTGLRGAKAMEALTQAEALATVGRTDLESASTALAGTLKTGIKGTENYEQAVGVLNATVGAGNMRMGDLIGALGTGLLTKAKDAGISLQDVGAALGTMTSQSIPAQAAGTRLGMTFAKLQDPAGKAQDALAKIGLEPLELARSMQKHGLLPTLSKLSDHLKGLSKVQRGQVISQIFGGGRSAGAIKTLLQSLDDLQAKYDQIGRESGKFAEKLASANEQPAQRLKRAWVKFQAYMIDFGLKVLPAAADALSGFTALIGPLAGAFNKLPRPLRASAGGLVLLSAAVGPVAYVVGGLQKLVGTLVILRGAFTAARLEQAKWLVGMAVGRVVSAVNGIISALDAMIPSFGRAGTRSGRAFGVAFRLAAVAGAVAIGAVLGDALGKAIADNWGKIRFDIDWGKKLGIPYPRGFSVHHVTAEQVRRQRQRDRVLREGSASPMPRLPIDRPGHKRHPIGMALGGFVPFGRSGSFVVGERGREVMTMSRQGVAVEPLSAAPAAALAGGGGTLVAEAPVVLVLDGRQVAESTARWVKRDKARK